MKRLEKLMRLAAAPGSWRAARLGVAATVEHDRALAQYGFDVVVDVGANKGQFAAFSAMRWPSARIYCFEPLPDPREKLSKVLASVAPRRSQVFPYALGSENGSAVIHVASREDSSSLLPLGEEQKRIFGMSETRMADIEVRRLDDVLDLDTKSPTLLKIDVQGFELEVLKGALAALKSIDVIYVELSAVELYEGQPSADQVRGFLAEQGFSEKGTFNAHLDHDGRLVQEDVLFESSSRT